MSPLQIRSEVLRQRGEGRTFGEISKALAEKGIVGARSGKPISESTLCNIVQRQARQKKARPGRLNAVKAAVEQKKARPGRLNAVISILKLQSMDAGERIALALMVAE